MNAGDPLGVHITVLVEREAGADPPFLFGRFSLSPALARDADRAAACAGFEATQIVRELRQIDAKLGAVRLETAVECHSGYDDEDGTPITYWCEPRGAMAALAQAGMESMRLAMLAPH